MKIKYLVLLAMIIAGLFSIAANQPQDVKWGLRLSGTAMGYSAQVQRGSVLLKKGEGVFDRDTHLSVELGLRDDGVVVWRERQD